MLAVHLRINDAATGRPTPVRVRVSAPDGTHFAPHGRSVEFPVARNEAVGGAVKLGPERWFYTAGACEVALPAGVPLRVQATKGPEFTPLDQTVTLGAGQMALRFAVERWANPAADGWVSVDSRCHFLTPHDTLLEAAAEGLGVANLLATMQPFPSLDGTAYPTVPNLAAFSGQTPALDRDGTAVVVNTFNTHPVLGKVGLLHSHRPVFPLAFGGDETDDWSVSDWCDQCHRKGGLVVWVDAFEPAGGVTGGEALVAAVLGKIDALEVTPAPRKAPLLPWVYRLWDAGVLVPLVGGSGKDSNRVPLGSVRTYARVGTSRDREGAGGHCSPSPAKEEGNTTPVAHASWVEAVRAGRTFATAGPLLDLTRDGTRFRPTARSPSAGTALELVANGQVVAAGTGAVEAVVEAGWVAARCPPAAGAFAHTSPVAIGGRTRKPEAVAALLKLIDQTREWVDSHGRFTQPKRKQSLLDRCSEATARLGAAP